MPEQIPWTYLSLVTQGYTKTASQTPMMHIDAVRVVSSNRLSVGPCAILLAQHSICASCCNTFSQHQNTSRKLFPVRLRVQVPHLRYGYAGAEECSGLARMVIECTQATEPLVALHSVQSLRNVLFSSFILT